MGHYVGLDVSMKTVFICVIDEGGTRVKECELSSTPEAIGSFLMGTGLEIAKIGLESGNLSHWLKKGLLEMNYEVVVMESRKMAAILATVINKTDTNDARGIAEALRVGHYRETVHRSDKALEIKTVLNCRNTLIRERVHLVNSIKGHLKVYGIKLGKSRKKGFNSMVEEKIAALSERTKDSIIRLLKVLEKLEVEIEQCDRAVQEIAQEDEEVQMLKTIDGVGDITALTFKAEIDDAKRFANSKDVAAYIGLTPTQYSSGETKRQGRISKKGSKEVRYLLVEAATVLLTRCRMHSKHRAWAMKLVKKKGMKKAQVALARKLAVTMHSMLINKKEFERGKKPSCKKVA